MLGYRTVGCLVTSRKDGTHSTTLPCHFLYQHSYGINSDCSHEQFSPRTGEETFKDKDARSSCCDATLGTQSLRAGGSRGEAERSGSKATSSGLEARGHT